MVMVGAFVFWIWLDPKGFGRWLAKVNKSFKSEV